MLHDQDDAKSEKPTDPPNTLKCVDFGWISSWETTTSSSYGGKASLEQLQEHPEQSGSIHVVI